MDRVSLEALTSKTNVDQIGDALLSVSTYDISDF